ncbi:MAG: DNA-binding response regulator [Frankiales bacterium]|nr:DNA-binding response regulator [Frankiales bacterium]
MRKSEADARLRVVVGEPSGCSPMIAEIDGFEVVARSCSFALLASAVLNRSADLVLLDARLAQTGIELARGLHSRYPGVPIVAIALAHDDQELFALLRAGVQGYLLQDTPPSSLARALRGVLAGEPALPRAVVSRVLNEFRRRAPGRPRLDTSHVHLTDREWEVLELLGQGLDTDAIAKLLFISPVTVRTHVSAVLRKLDVDSRAAAVRLLQHA